MKNILGIYQKILEGFIKLNNLLENIWVVNQCLDILKIQMINTN